MSPEQRRGYRRCLVYGGILALLFSKTLVSFAGYVYGTDLHSHILLVPFVCGYLLSIRRSSLPRELQSSPWWAAGLAVIGLAAAAVNAFIQNGRTQWSANDHFALVMFGFVCLTLAGGFLFLGRRWIQAALFPACFLFFLIPLPDAWAESMETASQQATAEVVEAFFRLTGMPYVREGVVYQLVGIKIQIAQECSGIRSSWVLFITSLVAANVFLASGWRRALLVLAVIPLGLLRNAFRILVIAWLCVDVGPYMIDSDIHHHGGPIFFAASMLPFVLLLGWLRRGETQASQNTPPLAEGNSSNSPDRGGAAASPSCYAGPSAG
jgi:exosortase C (VPDSG-CTERM-specific)